MSSQIMNPNSAGLAALSTLRTGLAQTRASLPAIVGGAQYLRLLKDGEWVLGREDSPVAPGTEAIVNPLSIQTGYSCWTNRAPGQGKNENLGEEMWGIGAVKPPSHTLPQHHDPRTQELCAWKDCMGVEMKFITGTFEGQQAMFKTTSVGGLRAMTALVDAILARLDLGTDYVCPIIEIDADSYQHASYGRTYVPLLKIVGWANMQGEEAEEVLPEAPKVATQRPAPAPAPQPEPEQPVTDPNATAPAGRRRRA